MKAVVAAFNQEKALVGVFSVIVQLRQLIANSTISYTIQYYLDCLQQFESILPGVIKSDFVWAGGDEEVSISGVGPTKYFLVVIFKLRYENISQQ